MKITDELKAEIKRRNPLREVMEEYGYSFEKDGADRLKTCCPFHREDDTPSFKIYEPGNDAADDNYHCYGCHAGTQGQKLKVYRGADVTEVTDAGNDVIGFIQNYENISFTEACKRLMVRVGIPIPAENPMIEKAKDMITAQNRVFYKELQKHQDVLDYLQNRGLDDNDLKEWRLGFVPMDHPQKFLRGKLVIGLIESHYEPSKAKTIAFAYRAMDGSNPKYINDPNGPTYKKGRYIYGMHKARRAIRRKGYAVVVEGYFDVILAHKHKIDNTVATCGTAFTDEQMDELRKLTDKLIFWYDGDDAGREAMERNLPSLLEKGFSVMFVDSDPFDPAEMIQKFGGEKIVPWIAKNAKPALQVLVDQAVDQFDTLINKARVDTLDRLLPVIEACKRKSDSAVYRSYLAQRLNITL